MAGSYETMIHGAVLDRPHFGFPFHRGGDRGRPWAVEQDSVDHVMSCVNVIARCPVGFRIERPDFGIPWLEYGQTVVPQGVVQSAMREFEDRAKITTSVERDWHGAADAIVEMEVEVTGG